MIFPFAASLPFIISVIFLLVLTSYKTIKNNYLIFFVIFFSFFSILFFYKGTVSDWVTYKKLLLKMDKIGSSYFEPGFDLIFFLAKKTIGFYLIIIINIFTFLIMLFKSKKVFDNNISFCIFSISSLLAFLPLLYGAVRQSIGFSFLLIALLCFNQKKYIESLLISILSCTFHKSSLLIIAIFLCYYLLYIMCLKRKILFILLTVILSIFLYYIFKTIAMNLFKYLNYYQDAYTDFSTRGIKDILLKFERIIFVIMSFYLLLNNKIKVGFNALYLSNIAGSIFYLIVSTMDLNLAGRTLAFFRFSDIFVLYFFSIRFSYILLYSKMTDYKNTLNPLAIIISIFYIIFKFYFTIVIPQLFI